ncbi:MAG: class I SAM-dependent methyltransferase [Gallionella sp.]|nr:class I SAM-dependent methyltransferase [Gallionella sp.]
MNSAEHKNDYWINFWTTNYIIENTDPQCQIGRTVNKIPIDPQKWQFHLSEIEKTLQLCPDDTLLDLCAGNGLITIPLSLKCRSVTAVDISNTLLNRIDTCLYSNITVVTGDARKINLPVETFSKGVMYFALQFFSERETIGIFETIYQSLMRGGTFLIGDILDIDRLFIYHNKPEWVTAYFDSVKNDTPAVGTWFKKEILVKMAKYVGFSDAAILSQHPDLINSHYRFDLLLTK